MTFLACSACGQRYFGRDAARRRRRCALCGGPLRREPRPSSPVAAESARGGPPLPAEPPPLMRATRGSFPDAPDAFASLIDFAAADVRRLASRERDLGFAWRDGDRLFRAALVEETRELHVVQLGPPEEGGGHVRLLGMVADGMDIERTLDGWREAAGRPDSLGWLRTRLRAAAGFRRSRAWGPTRPAPT
jgi:hypothetical protein